jgi:penicillin-binding protein 1C
MVGFGQSVRGIWVGVRRGMRTRFARRASALGLTLLLLAGTAVGIYHTALYWLGPPPLAEAKVSSKLIVDRNGQLLRPFTTPEGLWRLPISIDDVDPRYLKLLLAYEDKRFYEHGGVDGLAFGRALWQFVRYRRPVSGASTLTMQAARLLDDRPTRSYFAKFGQMFRAWQLEGLMPKRDVLELYMRLAWSERLPPQRELGHPRVESDV